MEREATPRAPNDLNALFNRRFQTSKKLGSGSFGDIFAAENIQNGERCAIKLESSKTLHPQLHAENALYQLLSGTPGIPKVRWYGVEGDYNILVLDLLGPSLEDLFSFCGRRFTLKTVIMLADQLIQLVESLHEKCHLHRDIKPDNFLMGIHQGAYCVHMIDLGLAKKYRDARTLKHIGQRTGKALTGTARYASIRTHQGVEQSRRDDLECLGYVLVYFLRGDLPWQGLRAESKHEKYKQISKSKQGTSLDELCKGCPYEFAEFLRYSRSVGFEERPDYDYCRNLFRELLLREGLAYDYIFDWNLPATKDRPPY